MPEKMVFHSLKYPQLELVMARDKTILVEGTPIKTPARWIRFLPGGYGVGEYRTDKEDEIAFLKASPEFKAGDIVVADPNKRLERKPTGIPLQTGAKSTGAREPERPEPGKQEEVGAAEVPSGLNF